MKARLYIVFSSTQPGKARTMDEGMTEDLLHLLPL